MNGILGFAEIIAVLKKNISRIVKEREKIEGTKTKLILTRLNNRLITIKLQPNA